MSGAPSFRGPILAMFIVAALAGLLLVATAVVRAGDGAEITALRARILLQNAIIDGFRAQRDYALSSAALPIRQVPQYVPPVQHLRYLPCRATPVFSRDQQFAAR